MERLETYGQGIGALAQMPGSYQTQVTPDPTALQSALGTASVVGGIMGSQANPKLSDYINMRTLNRPMFRTGGSAGTGITSGLAPRQGYQNGETVMSPAEKEFLEKKSFT